MNFRNAMTSARTVTSGRNRMRAVLVTGVLVAAPVAGLVTATSASAAGSSTWDAVASCESTNNWSANTGNGFSGGLQFTPSTWAAYGGTQYASSAAQASKSQQIEVAEHVLASQGPGAWPVCGPEAGLTAGGGTGTDASSTTTSSSTGSGSSASTGNAGTGASTAAPTTTRAAATGGDYTVRAGDTLGAIAAAHGTTWQHLYAANQSTIGADADTIYPGQSLNLG